MSNKTKSVLGTLVLRKLEGGMTTPSSDKYDLREVIMFVEAIIGKFIAREIKATGQINGDWLKTFENVKEKFHSARNEAYFILPCHILSLPKNMGLYQVSDMEGQDVPYIITNPAAKSVFSNLEANDTGLTPQCYLEQDKVFIDKTKADCRKVLLKVVPALSAYGDNEPVCYPSEMEAEIIEAAYNLAFYGDKQQKEVVDNNANTK